MARRVPKRLEPVIEDIHQLNKDAIRHGVLPDDVTAQLRRQVEETERLEKEAFKAEVAKQVEERRNELQRKSDAITKNYGRTSMSMLDPSEWNLEDAQEPYVLPDGSERRLRIIDVRMDKDSNGYGYLLPRVEIVDEPYSKDFTYFLGLPDPKMDAKRLNRTRFNMQQFCGAFNIDLTRPTNPGEDWPGEEGWAILGVQQSDQYGEQNYIKKFIIAH